MQEFLQAIGYKEVAAIPILVKVVLAVFCGGLLGLERTKKRRAAGVRTYSMVCLGSTIVMLTGIALSGASSSDAARLGAQVVSGIGFIGAGTIIVTGYHEIKGLTTAAGLWASACIGLAIGSGFYLVAIIAVAALYAIMTLGERMQNKLLGHIDRLKIYTVFSDPENITDFLILAKQLGITVHDCENAGSSIGAKVGAMFTVKLPENMSHAQALELLSKSAGVSYIEEI